MKGLRLIVQEQTAKIKDLGKEVEDAQHALFQVLKNEDWKTWFVKTSLYVLVNITFTDWLISFFIPIFNVLGTSLLCSMLNCLHFWVWLLTEGQVIISKIMKIFTAYP